MKNLSERGKCHKSKIEVIAPLMEIQRKFTMTKISAQIKFKSLTATYNVSFIALIKHAC